MSHSDPSSSSSGEPTGSTPYPGAGHTSPSGWPEASPPPRPSGLAIASVVVGGVSLLLCLVPVVNAVSIVGGIAAVVLGLVALRRLSPQVSGKGLALGGIALGVVSAIISVAIWVLIGAAVGGLVDDGGISSVVEELESSTD
ncbi:DUF4190 domain-containing protein [Cellulomonas sp. ATA003]|uniref:DUF4190 domain-containing protein n=1 Tax=Cellulomonas sp. ATA003 TaxID=3073064 RepID=UPI002872F15F|nr:DUF4190 domain-containing protein [Cellulomonas sp. ATA003]WNB85525.1 DUF4190 domain-containing protein [Cellulomonas sp. ATA003]